MTRDLVNMPANILTTQDFANRLVNFEGTGLEIEVLDEEELERLGMRTLVVSATDESRAFWVKQGLHTSSFCAPSEKAACHAQCLQPRTSRSSS